MCLFLLTCPGRHALLLAGVVDVRPIVTVNEFRSVKPEDPPTICTWEGRSKALHHSQQRLLHRLLIV